MPLPHDLCARLQNAFRARHAHVPLTNSTQSLGILSILLRSGFLTSFTRGTPTTPCSPEAYDAAPSDAHRRIWAELKYRDDQPSLRNMELVSKPSKRVFMTVGEIRRICTGRRAGVIKPLGMGEIAVVRTKSKEHEWIEAREAVQLKLGGEVICRAR
ncbi:ribosomal protein S8 [Pluteus cervinus]|uniref:Ribosomal protein S8 n=1 Tax=Pluteus cervinus TaxID=181527 RepID=A0ACD3AL18_9AGAR|nr:ribosomal protein S8 [Pluteus cervinus]